MLSLYSYNIPFVKPFNTSSHSFSTRKGFVLEFEGVFSEVAPLPGFSNESFEDVKKQLENMSQSLIGVLEYMDNPSSWKDFISRSGFYPSVRFGVDMLWWQLQAKRRETSLFDVMGGTPSEFVGINAVIPTDTNGDDLLNLITELKIQDYRTIKLKVGNNWTEEFAKLMVIRSYLENISIRIDVNGAWSPRLAETNLEMCSDVNIEFCEQPVKQTEMADYFQHSNFQSLIAPDESLLHENERMYWIDNPSTKNLVFKTALFGSYSELKPLVERYPDKRFVFTSSLDSGIANYLALHIAAHLGSKNTDHGFSTNSLLKNDTLRWKSPSTPKFKDFDLPYITSENINFDVLTNVRD